MGTIILQIMIISPFVLFILVIVNPVKSENIGFFWHVSDFHLDPRYGSNITKTHSKDKAETNSERDIFLGGYDEGCWSEERNVMGDFNCDSPIGLVELAVGFMKNMTNKNQDIKFIIWTGDDLSHGPEEVFSREETLETINIISAELATIGLPVLPSLGNHDIIPKNQYPTNDTN